MIAAPCYLFLAAFAYRYKRTIASLFQSTSKGAICITNIFYLITDALIAMKPPKGGFPDFIVGRYLEALDAIAKETGGRVQRKELSGPNGGG